MFDEVWFWRLAVFAVLGLPPLFLAIGARRKERHAARERERQRTSATPSALPVVVMSACVL
jgi:hypothetical protein